jgi:hypothetical protein
MTVISIPRTPTALFIDHCRRSCGLTYRHAANQKFEQPSI